MIEHKYHASEDGWNHGFEGADGGDLEVESVAWNRKRGQKM